MEGRDRIPVASLDGPHKDVMSRVQCEGCWNRSQKGREAREGRSTKTTNSLSICTIQGSPVSMYKLQPYAPEATILMMMPSVT